MTPQPDSFAALRLRDQVAVVTGGSRGIGRATAHLLGELGAHVVVNYVNNVKAADEVVNAVRSKGVESFAFKADVANLAESRQLIRATTERFQRIDILVCAAGIWEGAPVDEVTEELWDRTLNINLKGTWAVCSAAAAMMKEQRAGKIVIVSSTAGQRGEAGYSNYAASKGGQISFVKSLAAELAEWNIRVNAVAPGWVDTEMTEEALGDRQQRQEIARAIPTGSIASAEEVAGPIVFLCTDWARQITGEVLNVNGGSVLCG
ncbi:MAG TPA: SDR family NAD(P)-dependent oxidoreductase [Pyrinomonadaceae bacterium]|nr:SDR family NAD(P)-dependent oxidoreductase [Pyrinomonadaceae bacterium]